MTRKVLLCLIVGVCSLVLIILTCQNLIIRRTPNNMILWALGSFPNIRQKPGAIWGEWSTYKEFCVWSLSSAQEMSSPNESITLCTQGTPEYLHHITELCYRWDGPISVAVYGPEQFHHIKRVIYKFRQCNTCVRLQVSWHVFYESEGECPTRPYFGVVNNSWKCSDGSYLKIPARKRTSPYPINVARNLARLKSCSYFVMATDIELYPSDNIASRFLKMLQEDYESYRSPGRRVWVLPVFEVDSRVEAPRNKSDLLELLRKNKAIPFHKYRCVTCHKIPNLKQWMNAKGDSKKLRVVQNLKRDKYHGLQDWEPFFIGTKNEPNFDSRLSWEGKQNKMQVAFEMCILDYDFLVLDDAFLVHSPGINKYNASKEEFRMKYAYQNDEIIKQVKNELRSKFPNATRC